MSYHLTQHRVNRPRNENPDMYEESVDVLAQAPRARERTTAAAMPRLSAVPLLLLLLLTAVLPLVERFDIEPFSDFSAK